MKLAKSQVSADWSFNDLEKALKNCKNGKARDEHGFIYEIFKYGGPSLKVSMLQLFNLVKRKQAYPSIFSSAKTKKYAKFVLRNAIWRNWVVLPKSLLYETR